jgi:SAM-dependent methyltransferase
VAGTVPHGDPRQVKQLYVELGELLEEAYGDDVGAVPLLSFPATATVAARLVGRRSGPVLDAGCGPYPAAAIALARVVGEGPVVALDIGAATVRLARRRAAGAGVLLLGVVGDVEALPFRSAAFAGGVCDDTLEHLPDDARGVAELARVLGPEGRMVLATPNRHALDVLWRRLGNWRRGTPRPASAYYAAASHLREYTWREWDGLLRPRLVVHRRATIGWDEPGARRRLASVLVRFRPLRRFGRMLVWEVSPRRRS